MPRVEEKFWNAVDLLRGSLEMDRAVNFLYVLYLWKRDKLAGKNSFASFYDSEISIPGILKVFESLSQNQSLFKAYLMYDRSFLVGLKDKQLIELLNIVKDLDEMPPYSYAMARIAESNKILGEFYIPEEIADLALGLVGKNSKSIYSPFSSALNFVCRNLNFSYFIESYQRLDFFASLFREIDGVDVTFNACDPLLNPTFVSKKASHLLEEFDSAVCFPPFGKKLMSKEFYMNDRFNRFKFFNGKGSAEIPYIEHMIAHVRDRVIIHLPVGFLFRSGIEQGFRKFLVDRNYVESIIHMPSNLLPTTAIETVFMVLNKNKSKPEVLFIDLRKERFCAKRSRKNILQNPEEVIELCKKRKEVPGISCLASYDQLTKNDFSFSVDRYVIDSATQKLQESIQKYPVVCLGNIAELKRSQMLKDDEAGSEIFEISPSDLPAAGYVKPCGKVKIIDRNSSKYKTYKLQTGDVILTTKGTIGKVGLVGEDNEMIASQAFQIIRLKDGTGESRYLYMFLKSELGQTLLEKLTSGSVMPQIPANALSKLEIPWPDLKTQKELSENFNEEIKICEEIERLQGQLNSLKSNFLKK